MVWKKNFVSIILWVVYFGAVSAALICYSYSWMVRSKLLSADIAPVAAVGIWGGLSLLFVLCRLLVKRLPGKILSGKGEFGDTTEGILFVAMISAGFALRVLNLSEAGESAGYFEAAKVAHNSPVPEVAHGATYFYLHLLRLLFLVAGNKWMAGIWLQLVLQMISAILLYLAVRKLCGAVSGIVLFSLIMLLPSQIMRGLYYGPDMMYLCIYAVSLLFVSCFLCRQVHSHKSYAGDFVLLLFSAASVGLCSYLDIMGITLLVPVFVALFAVRRRQDFREYLVLNLSLLVLAVLFFAGSICLDAFASQRGMEDIWRTWLQLYSIKSGDIWFWFAQDELISTSVLLGFMVFGAWGFWLSGKHERFTPWILLLFLVCLVEYFCIPAQSMNADVFLVICGGVLGGVGIRECLCGRRVVASEVLEETPDEQTPMEQTPMEQTPMEQTPIAQQSKAQAADPAPDKSAREEASEAVKVPKQVKYIENPLPVPKKRVKKVPDYSFQPQEELMHYDIEIDEEDEFDL